jgi:hypothetical protein
MSATLTRAQAHDLIERCGGYREQLQTLARHWGVAGYWDDTVSGEHWHEVLTQHVDDLYLNGNDIRSYGPHDNDPTDLTSPED